MADKITIAALDIDTDALTKAATETKKAINELKQEQKDLRKEGKESEAQFVKNEATLKKLNKTYNTQKNTLSALTDENNKLVKSEKALEDALNETVNTENQATKSNQKLLAIRKDLNANTAEGKKRIEQINAKIDENNKLLEGNASTQGKVKIGIGKYSDGIKQAFEEMGLLNGVLNESIPFQDKFNTLVQRSGKSFKAASQGTNLASKALGIFKVALAATGIGLLVVALGLLVQFFAKFSSAIDGVKSALAPLVSLFEVLLGWFGDLVTSGGKVSASWDDLKKEAADLTRAKRNLIKATRDLQQLNAELARENALLSRSYARLSNSADDTTTSFKEQREAAEQAAKIGEELARNNLRLAQAESARAFAALNAEKKGTEERVEAQKEYNNVIAQVAQAQIELDNTLFDNRRRLRQIDQDQAEQQLDFLIDGAQLTRETLQGQIDDEELTTQKRIEANTKLSQLNRKNAEDQVKILQAFTQETIDLNNLVTESDAAVLEERARNLGLSEILTNRLLEVIRESQTEQKELAENEKKIRKSASDEAEAQRMIDEAKRKEVREKELDEQRQFEDRKRELQNQIELENAETEEEKAILKAEQDFEKQQLELERLQLEETQKTELLALLETQKEQVLADIRDTARDSELKKIIETNKKVLDADKKGAEARKKIAAELTSTLTGLLGDSVGAQLASLAIEAAAEAGLVGIDTASAQARNLAQATAAAPPPFNAPLIAAASTQNVAMGARSTAAIGKIFASAAIKSAGGLARAAFYEGGQVPMGTGGRITAISNIPTQTGGDNILATVKSGEVILNEDQQRRAGGSAFFRSIGVPGFQTGGIVGSPNTARVNQAQRMDLDELSDLLADKINAIKIVAIEGDITDAQAKQADIVSGADV